MKKFLLPENGKFYKANLHTHTTLSDGKYSPEEVKSLYSGHGYSIVAFTDHEILVPHPELTDKNFVAITSTELNIGDCKYPYRFDKGFHLNFYAKDENADCIPLFNADNVWIKRSLDYVSEAQKAVRWNRFHSVEAVNKMIETANENGYLVCYNLPVWSFHGSVDYLGVKGLWGLELYNTGCVLEAYPETTQPLFELLPDNPELMPVCCDDCHHDFDMFGGFSMIKMPELTYENTINAMINGDMYSSSGPLIDELYFEDGKVYIKTSPAKMISLVTEGRQHKAVIDKNCNLTAAEFDISEYIAQAAEVKHRPNRNYFRLEVRDASGEIAYTKAYGLDELNK